MTTQDTPHLTTPGDRLKRARLHAGLSLDDVAYQLRDLMGKERAPSRDTLRRRYEGADSEAAWDPIVIVHLSDIYDVNLIDLSNDIIPVVQGANEVITRAIDRLGNSGEWTVTVGYTDQAPDLREPALA